MRQMVCQNSFYYFGSLTRAYQVHCSASNSMTGCRRRRRPNKKPQKQLLARTFEEHLVRKYAHASGPGMPVTRILDPLPRGPTNILIQPKCKKQKRIATTGSSLLFLNHIHQQENFPLWPFTSCLHWETWVNRCHGARDSCRKHPRRH